MPRLAREPSADALARWPYCWPWQRVRAAILRRDNYRCTMCGAPATSVDHVIPWRVGGAPYDPANLRAACNRCNYGRAGEQLRRPW